MVITHPNKKFSTKINSLKKNVFAHPKRNSQQKIIQREKNHLHHRREFRIW